MILGLRDAYHAAGVDARFSVFSYYPARDARIAEDMPDVTVHAGHPRDLVALLAMILLHGVLRGATPARWRRDIETLRASDGVLLIGGTTFEDSMLFKAPWNMLAALPAYWLGRPVVFLSQTIGPVAHPINRWLARWTLMRASEVHGRGRRSEAWVRSLGIRATYQPDLSFSMAVPAFEDIAEAHEVVGRLRDRMREAQRTFVGFAPNSIVLEKARKRGIDYVAFMAGAIEEAHRQGHQPVLIPHSYLEDLRRMHNNDRSLCLAIMERLQPDVPCEYVNADLSAQALRSLIGRLHLLVASRFHSMISSLSMGVPPITYGWGDHKYLEVLEEFGVPELYATFDALDITDFAGRLRRTHERRDDLAQRIVIAGAAVRAQSMAIPQVIARAVGAQDGADA